MWTFLASVAVAAEPVPAPPPAPVSADVTAPEESPSASQPPAPVPPIQVTLIDPGHGPKRALAYKLSEGASWQVQVRRTSRLVTASPGLPDDATDTPPSTHVIGLSSLGGRLVASLVDYDLDGVDVATLAKVHAELQPLAPARRLLPADPRALTPPSWAGVPEALSEIGAELLDDAAWALDSVTVPLPEGRVGVGARWSWSRDVSEQGVQLSQKLEARLIDVRGRTAVVDIKTDGGAGAVVVDGLAISGVTLVGTGTVWLDFTRPPATGAVLDLIATLQLPATDAAPAQTATATTHLTVATKPKHGVDRPGRGG